MFRHFARLTFVFVCLSGALTAAGFEHVWLDVPFVKQEKEACGAASIAMVMQYWRKQEGLPVSDSAGMQEIKRALRTPGTHGIYASAMADYFQQHGFRAFSFNGEWNDLQQHLVKGRPLIVALKPSRGASLHYVVVAGMDPEEGLVLLNDPAQRKLLKESRSRFEKQWSATGKWTLLAVPQAADRE